MKQILIVFPILLLLSASTVQKPMEVEVISLDQLRLKMLRPENDTLYVVNFWATWCKPCVAELPYFEQARRNHQGKKMKILLVSLDFMSEKEKVKAFVAKKGFQNEVCLLNGGNPNNWIDTIDKSWDGAIPATVMYRKAEKVYFQVGDFTQTTLDSIIQIKTP